MAKNIFKNLPTEKHEKLKKIVSARVGKRLGEYTQSKPYILDVIANRTNQQGRKIALAEVDVMSKEVAKHTTQGDPTRVRNQFKAFVKSDTGVLSNRYDWSAIQHKAEETMKNIDQHRFEVDLSDRSAFDLFQELYVSCNGFDDFEPRLRTQARAVYWELYNRFAEEE